jgi:hypothetical protein
VCKGREVKVKVEVKVEIKVKVKGVWVWVWGGGLEGGPKVGKLGRWEVRKGRKYPKAN